MVGLHGRTIVFRPNDPSILARFVVNPHVVAIGVGELIPSPLAGVWLPPGAVDPGVFQPLNPPRQGFGPPGPQRHVPEPGVIARGELEAVRLVVAVPAQVHRIACLRGDGEAEQVGEVREARLRRRGQQLGVADMGDVAHIPRGTDDAPRGYSVRPPGRWLFGHGVPLALTRSRSIAVAVPDSIVRSLEIASSVAPRPAHSAATAAVPQKIPSGIPASMIASATSDSASATAGCPICAGCPSDTDKSVAPMNRASSAPASMIDGSAATPATDSICPISTVWSLLMAMCEAAGTAPNRAARV